MIEVEAEEQYVIITHTNALGPAKLVLTLPEANALQAELRKMLAAAGVTVRDVVG
jgi:hypothetical protein